MAESVLGRIVERKRVEVEQRLAGGAPEAQPTTRSLAKALARPGARFIMEVKQASPSGHRARHSIVSAAKAYAGVADAVSVLTDGADFGGSLDDIGIVRQHFEGPILAKDFIVDVRQVAEARSHGADAVLVMLSVLDDTQAAAVLAAARSLEMDAIVEVHDEAEMARARRLGPAIVGINNRDLKNLAVDLGVTRRLAAQAPKGSLLVAESGIRSRRDVASLCGLVDGFLVGSSLMAAEDMHAAARELVHGRVKICGLTRPDDVETVADSGAVYAGLVLVPETPRVLNSAEAADLAELARRRGLKAVAVFRNEDPEKLLASVRQIRPDVVQVHGNESEDQIAAIRAGLDPAVEIWAASPVIDREPGDRPGADRLLFDSVRSGQCGGTGTTFDWSRLAGHRRLAQSLIGGGISPSNAARAACVGAFGLDVGSGVEAAPGRKDPAILSALFEALRPASRTEAQCA